MIRIAVIGANGQAGRHIVAEALARGFEVTAFVRGSTAPAAQHVVHKMSSRLSGRILPALTPW